jgi:hypothetical protein
MTGTVRKNMGPAQAKAVELAALTRKDRTADGQVGEQRGVEAAVCAMG